jgi:hypothetical protein
MRGICKLPFAFSAGLTVGEYRLMDVIVPSSVDGANA